MSEDEHILGYSATCPCREEICSRSPRWAWGPADLSPERELEQCHLYSGTSDEIRVT